MLRIYAAEKPDEATVERRILDHLPLVRKLAWHVYAKVRNALEIEELMQEGMLALVEAAQRFQDTGEASFGSYASIRIRGAMIDLVRRQLASSRVAVKKKSALSAAGAAIAARGEDPSDRQALARELGILAHEVNDWIDASEATKQCSLDEVYGDHSIWYASELPTPEEQLDASQIKRCLVAALKELPEREALVLQLYYLEECNLEEIGEILSVTVGRVSQIKKQALGRVREALAAKLDPVAPGREIDEPFGAIS